MWREPGGLQSDNHNNSDAGAGIACVRECVWGFAKYWGRGGGNKGGYLGGSN